MRKLVFAALISACCGAFASEEHWGYDGEGAPSHWAEIDPAFFLCQEGKNQSPVDLNHIVDADLPKITFDYKSSHAEIVNNGHSVQVNLDAGGSIMVDGRRFALKQFHVHVPSENYIGGHEFPMEVHLVHTADNGMLAVVAVMFDQGDQNQALKMSWSQVPGHAGEGWPLKAYFDSTAILPEQRDYYRFSGSLTTPPCSEGVTWLVMKHANHASEQQFKNISEAIGFANNRPLQPLNSRLILE